MSSKHEPSPSDAFPGGALEDVLVHVILPRLVAADVEGLFKLEIRGEGGGVRYLRVGAESEIVKSIPSDQHPDVIVRADRGAFDALIAGRLKLSDGLLSERLSMVGNVAKIVALKNLITG